ncbi:hypothetical protein C8Q76DRAFT_801001 [Earliella scabrosa]|nr:hypothetical protein C8Q76DRAFT_801001 [Earliella scabrosa]
MPTPPSASDAPVPEPVQLPQSFHPTHHMLSQPRTAHGLDGGYPNDDLPPLTQILWDQNEAVGRDRETCTPCLTRGTKCHGFGMCGACLVAGTECYTDSSRPFTHIPAPAFIPRPVH